MSETDERYAHLDDPAEREWLTNVSPLEVARNAHRFYDFMREGGMPADSYTREMAFTKAGEALGVAYKLLYDAWLSERAVPEAALWAQDEMQRIAEQVGELTGTRPFYYLEDNGGSPPYVAVFFDEPGSQLNPSLRTRIADPAAALAHMRAKLDAAHVATSAVSYRLEFEQTDKYSVTLTGAEIVAAFGMPAGKLHAFIDADDIGTDIEVLLARYVNVHNHQGTYARIIREVEALPAKEAK
jgi:hypothetical protein